MNLDNIRSKYKLLNNGTYFMNAAVGAMHDDVFDASTKVWSLMREYGDIKEEMYLDIMDNAQSSVANLLNISKDDLAFNPNTSHNMNLIAMMLLEKSPKREIIIPSNEFPSSLIPFHHHGFSLKMIEPNQSEINIDEIIGKITSETAAVVVSAISFLTGYKIDLIKLGKELDERGIPFIVNATQMLGAFEIPFKEAKIKACSASVHKWFGAGFGLALFLTDENFRKNIKWPLAGWTSVSDPSKMSLDHLIMRPDTSASQTGCIAFDNIAAVGAAANIIKEIGQENISNQIIKISSYLVSQLSELPVNILSFRDEDSRCSGTINLIPHDTNLSIEEIVKELYLKKIYVNDRKGTMRVSVHFYNTKDEVDRFISALRELL